MNIQDVVALVTGGASGLGEATVRELAARGAKAVIFDLDEGRGEKLARETGENVLFVRCDVTGEDSVRQAIQQSLDRFGKVTAAVNCAGVPDAAKVLGKKGPLPLSLFNRVIAINLVGTLNVIRLAVEQMVNNAPNEEGEKGVIINRHPLPRLTSRIGQAAYARQRRHCRNDAADRPGMRRLRHSRGHDRARALKRRSWPDCRLPSRKKWPRVPFPRRLGRPVGLPERRRTSSRTRC